MAQAHRHASHHHIQTHHMNHKCLSVGPWLPNGSRKLQGLMCQALAAGRGRVTAARAGMDSHVPRQMSPYQSR